MRARTMMIVAVLITLVVLILFFISLPTRPSAPVACTLDAKLCPDGSSVGRVGPNCEFAPCPGE